MAGGRKFVKLEIWGRSPAILGLGNMLSGGEESDSGDNELQIGQNSLVVFRQGASDPFLDRREAAVVVLEGELTGTVNADYGAFAVELPAGLIELSADEGTDETVER